MKTLTKILAFALLISLFSCKKGSNSNALIGRWKLTEYYLSAGGPGYWTPATAKTLSYVLFNSNGSLGGSAFSGYVRYTIKDSTTVVLYDKNNVLENYNYKIANGILQMSPAGPIVCYEGCSSRFIRFNP